MKISKSAVSEFKNLITRLKRDFPVRKDGKVRDNLSYMKRLEMGDIYNSFIHDLVGKEIRPYDKYNETTDITKLWVPHNLLKELETLMWSVNAGWTFLTPEDVDRYLSDNADIAIHTDTLVDHNVVIFGDNIVVPQRRR